MQFWCCVLYLYTLLSQRRLLSCVPNCHYHTHITFRLYANEVVYARLLILLLCRLQSRRVATEPEPLQGFNEMLIIFQYAYLFSIKFPADSIIISVWFFFNDQLVRPESRWTGSRYGQSGAWPSPGYLTVSFWSLTIRFSSQKYLYTGVLFFLSSGSKNVGVANDGTERRVKRPFSYFKKVYPLINWAVCVNTQT